MQKKNISIILYLLASMCAQGQNAASYWRDSVEYQYSDSNLTSFSVTCTYPAKNFVFDMFLEKYKSGVYMTTVVDGREREHLIIRNDTVILIENDYANITYDGGPDNLVCNYMKRTYSNELFDHLPILHSFRRIVFHGMHDTTVGNIDYHILKGTLLTGHIFNDESQEYDIPDYEYLRYWCNKNTNRVDKIVVSRDSTTMLPQTIYEMKDYTVGGKWLSLPEKYNIHSSLYSDYALYDVTKGDPAPSVIGHGTDNTEMSEEILRFPLVRPNYDTITLGDTTGWKLLEFWTYGCKPCIAFMEKLAKERDSLGYRILEKNGISIFCIENRGGVTSRFQSYASRWKAEDILYAARGMQLLAFRIAPYYYLYAPDNSLVYHGTTDAITDTLLHAKSVYEKRKKAAKKVNGPYIVMDKTEYDYGEIPEGSDGECVFWIKNTGNKPLAIDHVSSSCGCTTAEYPQKPIAAGKKEKIVVKYHTSNVGSFQKTIVIVSNSTNNPRMVLKVKGKVIPSPCHR